MLDDVDQFLIDGRYNSGFDSRQRIFFFNLPTERKFYKLL